MAGDEISSESPLRLPYPPGEYLCTWMVPDEDGTLVEISGNLEVGANAQPKGMIYGRPPVKLEKSDGHIGFSFPEVVSLPVVWGTLANGGTVALVNAQIEYWSPERGNLHGGAALIGPGAGFFDWSTEGAARGHSLGEPAVSSVEFQVGALDALLGSQPIKQTNWPHAEAGGDEVLSATLNGDTRAAWNVDGIALDVRYDNRFNPYDPYRFRAEFSPVARLSLEEATSLQVVVDDYLSPFRAIVSIATGKSQGFTMARIELEGFSGGYQVFANGFSQDVFASNDRDVRKQKCVVRAKADDVSLLDLVMAWRRLTHDHHPLIETYGRMLHAKDQHPRSRFLLLLQAMEGLHGYETRIEREGRRVRYEQKRQRVLDKAGELLTRDSLQFLKTYLPKRPPGSLDSVLRELLSQLPDSVLSLLVGSDLVQEVVADHPELDSELSAIRVVRNDLAHGNRGYDVRKLNEVVRILERIVRAHTLRILGCPAHVVNRVFAGQ